MKGHRSLTSELRDAGVFAGSPFVLIDVGCRDGIDRIWRQFAPDLVAHGFDPIVDECRRLQREEPLDSVRYHARFVGLDASHPFVQRKNALPAEPTLNPWDRLSTARALSLLASEAAAPTSTRAPSSTLIGIADFVRQAGLGYVDFIKIDVDGTDLEVLISASDILTTHGVLGVFVEVSYYGGPHDTSNTFHNIDRFLRQHDFALSALEVRRYSKKDLPAPFVKRMAAQTTFGAPFQGDALYVRDLAAPHLQPDAERLPAVALAKLAAIFALFDLPDCAAEVVRTFASRFNSLTDPDRLLDDLAASVAGEHTSYMDYMGRFEEDPLMFRPAVERSARSVARGPETDVLQTELAGLRETVAHLSETRSHTQRKLRARRREVERLVAESARLRTRLRLIEQSASWRLTTPLRRLKRLFDRD
jgi:Methyltransferase FkbM domain